MPQEECFKKRVAGTAAFCASGFPASCKAQLPIIQVKVNGQCATALVDSGCSQSIVSRKFLPGKLDRGRQARKIVMMNGESVDSDGEMSCEMTVDSAVFRLNCLVTGVMPGFDVLLGMDAVQALGGMSVSADGKRVKFSNSLCAVAVDDLTAEIVDKDFVAEFREGSWTVSWNWVDGESEPKLYNKVAQYKMSSDVEEEFTSEVEEWIDKGWLQRYHGEHDGIIPFLAVSQHNKGNVRPVMDFRELNNYVSSHTGSSVVCGEKIREWRKLGTNIKILDLKKAYLQVRVNPDLWRYQVVMHKNVKYCLTRLGFGLNVAPKIMTAIVNYVLKQEEGVKNGTDSYIDDIIVNEDIVRVEKVEKLLRKYGLESKPAETISGARVLGLRVYERNGRLLWKRDNFTEPPRDRMTKRELFSFCGKLVGHFPVAKWLRPYCSVLKRLANVGCGWDECVEERIVKLLRDLWERVNKEDPVCGVWTVPSVSSGRVWCDASSLAIGASVEVQGDVIEDGCWLRREGDSSHINLAELESVLKGVNLAIAWGLDDIEVMTDSNTVFCWLRNLVTDKSRMRTHGMGEALVRRRLGLLSDIMDECGIRITPVLVKSAENKADQLTRVPKEWLKPTVCCTSTEVRTSEDNIQMVELIRRAHENVHCGVEKTLFLVRNLYPDCRSVSAQEVREVVGQCEKCRSIDPAPVRWEKGCLSVETNWSRLACDVTHYEGKLFLTVIDSGPSRFAIWKPMVDERLPTVINTLIGVFREMGPPSEILLDNSRTFKSDQLVAACNEWGTNVLYRAAYRPSGNGIIERNHRTIKRIAARTGKSPLTAVFWYNFLPLDGLDASTAPHRRLFRRQWRNPLLLARSLSTRSHSHGFIEGDEVFVKPPDARCTTPWSRGVVTAVTDGAVEVNGVHRHIADIRRVRLEPEDSEDEDGETSDYELTSPRRSSRVTAQPWRYADSDYDLFL